MRGTDEGRERVRGKDQGQERVRRIDEGRERGGGQIRGGRG